VPLITGRSGSVPDLQDDCRTRAAHQCTAAEPGVSLAGSTNGRSPIGDGPTESQEYPHVATPTDEQFQGVWLTQEAHDRLKAELDQLVAGRPAMSAEINARREEGDLKENGGYHAAKDEQGKQEARIRQLTDLLRKATVGEAPTEVTNAATGTVITVKFAGDDETEKFLLGSREIAGSTGLTVYSPESALGAAIMGAKPGAQVTYQAPNGRDISVEVVGIEPFVP
jgi:transcription elongation factor GreA